MSANADAAPDGDGGWFDHVDRKQTGVYGGGAWLAGIVLIYVIATVAGITDTDRAPTTDTLEFAVVLLYEGMGGLVEFDASGPAALDTRGLSLGSFAYTLLDSRFFGLGIFLHYLVPIVVLVVAGYLLAGEYLESPADASFEDRFDAWLGGVAGGALFGGLVLLTVFLFGPDGTSLENNRLLLAVVVHPVVFSGIGAARQVGFGITSLRETLAGIGTFALGFGLWSVLADPIGDRGIGDLGGAADHLSFFGLFLADHGVPLTPGRLLELEESGFGQPQYLVGLDAVYGSASPAFALLLAPAIAAATLVYREETTDAIRAAGTGARLAAGYFLAVFLIALAVFGSRTNDLYDALYGTGTEQEVRNQLVAEANLMFGAYLPDAALVGGVLWIALFGAVGGVAGAKAVESQQTAPQRSSGSAGPGPQATAGEGEPAADAQNADA